MCLRFVYKGNIASLHKKHFSRFALSIDRYENWYKTPNDIYLFLLVISSTNGKITFSGKGKVKGGADDVHIEVSEIGYVHLSCLKIEK